MIMKKIFTSALLAWCAVFANAQNNAAGRNKLFNDNWLFTKDSASGAEASMYDDTKWRAVTLPHDWSIEDLPNQSVGTVEGPFDKNSLGKGATGFTDGGTGWYRKKFTTDKASDGKQVSIEFDGVYMNADIWLNGHHLGNHPYGYTAFSYDLTQYLNPVGQVNILAVRVRNEGKNSRWYSGSGIYRNVWLNVTNKIHVAHWGTYITTPEVSANNAAVIITTSLTNESTAGKKISVTTTIISPAGTVVGKRAAAYETLSSGILTDSGKINIVKPVLWFIEKPVLYKAVVKVEADGKLIDQSEQLFGIRSIEFSSTKGFLLNGKRVILKGGCIHHDNGPLGSAAIDRAEERKVELLKKAGYNAIRCSHNPPSTAFLNACDKLGMLVLDEAFDMWRLAKNPQDYHQYFDTSWQKDIDAMVLRDRNHPSVIMWSIGNEIFEAPDSAGYSIGAQLAGEVRRLDLTRPVTTAIAFLPGYTKKPWQDFQPQLANVDIDGYNYFLEGRSHFFVRDSATAHRFDEEHSLHPQKTFIVTEYTPESALENYERSFKSTYLLGAFKWTAMDYIGEANIGSPRLFPQSRILPDGLARMAQFYLAQWPVYNSYCGDLDLVGDKKNASYYQDVVWNKSPIEILVHKPLPDGMREASAPWGFPDEIKSWSWPGQGGKKMQVQVYARGTRVALELNGKRIAEENIPPGTITATFEVEYQPGTLTAESYDGEKLTGSASLTTTGKAAAIRLVADRNNIKAGATDLSFVKVEIVDANGNVVPYADDVEVSYSIAGAGIIAGVGNGRMDDASSFQQNHKKVFHGKGLVVIRPNDKKGTITLKAMSNGLMPSQVTITTH